MKTRNLDYSRRGAAAASVAAFLHQRVGVSSLLAVFLLACAMLLGSAPTARAVTETLPAGTYIIPMNSALQPQIMKGYGLAVRLLHAGVPIKWIINPNKTANSVADFTANASRIKPTTQASTSRQFIAGPFAIYPGFEAQALVVINAFGGGVAVHQLTSPATVNVDATLVHKPKVAVFNQGGKAGEIHVPILNEAGLASGTHYQVVNNASSIGAGSCFTVATEPHSDSVTSGAASALENFLRSGGNFLGQCAAVRSYTQRGVLAGYQTDGDIGGSIQYANFSDPMAQFQGILDDEGGSVKSFKLTSNPGKRIAFDSNDGARYKAYVGRLTGVTTPKGGWVHYLAGHNYDGGGTGQLNGRRILMNAVLRAADRPDNCGLSISSDLAVTKVVSNSAPQVGSNVTFTITAINNGPVNATGVVVNDILPTGLTYVSHIASAGTYTPGTGIWDIGALSNTATRTLTITATVTAAALPSRTNTATITGQQADDNLSNNTASATVTPPSADLRVVKTVDNAQPTIGQNVTFTINTTNLGPNNATGVTVNDLLPAGLNYVSHIASSGIYTPATGVWNIGSLITGASQTLTLTATVTSAGYPSVTNAVSVTATQYDPVPANNFSSVTVNPIGTDYRITKTVNNATPQVGQNVTFTVTAINNGPINAADVVVNDLLPSGLVYVSHSVSAGTYTPGTGVWNIGTLNSGTSRTLTLTATATAAAIPSRTNTATITSSSPDSNPNDNTASATVTPIYADMRVVKTASNATPQVGQNVTFTIAVSNLGASLATGVVANDLLPAGLTYVSHSTDFFGFDFISPPVANSPSFNPATGVWTIGQVNTETTFRLNITATVTAAALPSVVNTATVTANQFDPNLGNNTSSVTVNPRASDLSIVKTVDNGMQEVGGNVVFTIVVDNNGPSNNTGVVVNDLLPAGLSYLSHTQSVGTYNSASGVWTIGNFNSGASATLIINAQVGIEALPVVVNTATISGDLFDINLDNNTSSATVSPGFIADLGVVKTVNNETPTLGAPVTFTVTATNAGPFPGTNVVVQDPLPAGLIYQSHTASAGTYNPATGQWTLGDLAVNATPTLNIVAITNTQAIPTVTNIASITGTEFDPNMNDNVAEVSVSPNYSDLSVVKTVDNRFQEVFGDVVFTLTASNLAGNNNTGVTVNDLLPAGLTYQSHTASVGAYDAGTGVWDIGNFAVGANATLTITARVGVGAVPSVTNTATITGDLFDNNTSNNTSSSTVNPPGLINDLVIEKTVNDPAPGLSDTITFLLNIGNNGPFAGTGVVVEDVLPPGLNYVSHIASVGTYTPATGLWAVGNLATDATASLSIVVSLDINAVPSVVNTATIGGNETDLDISNNRDEVTVTPNVNADLQVLKTVNVSPVIVGENVVFTIVASNNGPNSATSVLVNDIIPLGLEYLSHTTTVGAYNPASGNWSIGTLANGGSETLTITAKTNLLGGSNVLNVANATARETDPVPNNNSSTASVSILSGADVSIVKTVNEEQPLVGQTVIFTLTATNAGPETATDVIISDVLPDGLINPTNISGGGVATGNTITWPPIDIPVGETVTYTLEVTVAAPNP